MINKATTIAAVVVTFNRKVLLIECLNALLAQTRPIDRIYIIDNASSDGTKLLLEENNMLSHPLIDYRLMEENLGGAGGFYEGVKAAHEEGYDWIWVMDDDAEPLQDAIANLEPYFTEPDVVAVCPIVTDANNDIDFVNPHRGWFNTADNVYHIARSIQPDDLLGKDLLQIDVCSFVGLCFASTAIDRVGLPKREFFIHFDDIEFSRRLNSIGKILLIKNSVIKHKEFATASSTAKRYFLGVGKERTKYDKLWIHFFGYRNRIWLITHRKMSYAIMIKIYLRHLRMIISVVLYDDNKLSRIRFWNAAFFDGINGNFDNRKPSRILEH